MSVSPEEQTNQVGAGWCRRHLSVGSTWPRVSLCPSIICRLWPAPTGHRWALQGLFAALSPISSQPTFTGNLHDALTETASFQGQFSGVAPAHTQRSTEGSKVGRMTLRKGRTLGRGGLQIPERGTWPAQPQQTPGSHHATKGKHPPVLGFLSVAWIGEESGACPDIATACF